MVECISPSCGPYHILKSILNKVVMVEIDIEANPEIAQNAQVISTSTVQFVKDKELLEHIGGIKKKSVSSSY